MPHAAIPFRPHHRFAVPLPRSRRGGLVTRRFLAESRNISFPRRCGGSGERSEPIGALMPHAALWVVQLLWRLKSFFSTSVSMPHAALWVVQPTTVAGVPHIYVVSMPHAAIPFRPHHRFAVPLPRSRRGGLVRLRFLAESRNISFPRRCGGSGERSEPIGAPMPHAALWVVQRKTLKLLQILRLVSMPHAALWVVQPYALSDWRVVGRKFQCRTRLCGWCSATLIGQTQPIEWFQCRTQHDMWCNVQILVDEGAEMRFQCRTQHCMWCNCAFQRVQCGTKSFNAARSIVCGATKFVNLCQHPINVFQCRTQHDMWCNTSSLFFSRKEVKVSMPHAA